eukprot:403347201
MQNKQGYQIPDDDEEDQQYEEEGFDEQDDNQDIQNQDEDQQNDYEEDEDNEDNNQNEEEEVQSQNYIEDSQQQQQRQSSQQVYDNIQVNSNFQFPGQIQQNGLNRPQTAAHGQYQTGRMRPVSGKPQQELSAKQLQQQQQLGQLNNGVVNWGTPQQQSNMYSQPIMYQQPTYGNQSQINGFFPGQQQQQQQFNLVNTSSMSFKKRPNTGNRRNQMLQFALNKKSFISKNPSSAADTEYSRLRPKNLVLDRERLFDDAIKQKITANFLKDENLKLKTKVHILEGEMQKKEKFIDELIQQQDSYQIGGVGGPIIQSAKIGLPRTSTHLTLNLKRKIRELQYEVSQKIDEIELMKKNVRSTRLTEIEIENKMYIDECTRLRHQLEEVIKSKDTFADPEEMKLIESRFQQQDLLIEQLRQDNTQLAMIFNQKDMELNQIREVLNQHEQKSKSSKLGQGKELIKVKGQLKDRMRDIKSLRDQLNTQKLQNEELRVKIEEMTKKNLGSFISNRPAISHTVTVQNSALYSSQVNNDKEVQKLKNELSQKDSKIQELNKVVQTAQHKLQEKADDFSKLQNEKNKFKDLYDKYQDQVVQLQSQLEDLGAKPQLIQKQITNKAAPAQKQNLNQSNDKSFDKKSEQQLQKPRLPKVDAKKLPIIFWELKLKLQIKGFKHAQMKDFFFKPFQPKDKISIITLSQIFDSNGLSDQDSSLLARYLIEPQDQQYIEYDPDLTQTQAHVIQILNTLITPYQTYQDQTLIKSYQERLQKLIVPCKETLKETFQMEDYEETGLLTLAQFKESLETLDLIGAAKKGLIDEELFDYVIFVIYQKSEGLDKLKYNIVFDLIEGKLLQNQLSVGSDGTSGLQARKRPESSSPQKLKARNKDKFKEEGQEKKQKAKGGNSDDVDEDQEEDNYEEEFEQLLDKDDEEDNDKSPSVPAKKQKSKDKDDSEDDYDEAADKFDLQQIQQNKGGDEEDNQDEEDDPNDEQLDEEQMLDIAESCFVSIADAIIQSNKSVRESFKNYIIKEEFDEGQFIELLSPVGFLEGIKELGITDFEEIQVACLMRVLTKPELENAIMVKELIVIMENFGIQDDEEANGDPSKPELQEEQSISKADEQSQSSPDKSKSDVTPNTNSQTKKKKKKKGEAAMDLTQLDAKSIKILAKIILALMELNISLYDFFDGAIYEQLVKTKTKQNMVELISSKDFFRILEQRGVRKRQIQHENLQKFLSLDPNYPQLLMLKKIAKSLDEMAKNEELMAGILDQVDGDLEAPVHPAEQLPIEQNIKGGERLITIGEDKDEDFMHQTNKNQGSSSMTNNGQNFGGNNGTSISNKQITNANNDEDDNNNYDEDDEQNEEYNQLQADAHGSNNNNNDEADYSYQQQEEDYDI